MSDYWMFHQIWCELGVRYIEIIMSELEFMSFRVIEFNDSFWIGLFENLRKLRTHFENQESEPAVLLYSDTFFMIQYCVETCFLRHGVNTGSEIPFENVVCRHARNVRVLCRGLIDMFLALENVEQVFLRSHEVIEISDDSD